MSYVRNIIIALLVCGVVPVWADTPNNRPTAILKVSCPSSSENCDDFTTGKVTGPAPLTVHFDGGDSSDSDGEIQLYHFDYSSSSLHEAEGFDEGAIDNRSHTYDNPGSYLAYLMVKDNDGKWSKIAYRHIHVTPLQLNSLNNPPTAVLKASCGKSQDDCDDSVPGHVTGPAPLTVHFDGGDSSDIDGSVEYFRFDLGFGLYSPGYQPVNSLVYLDSGNYVATLIVTDNHGVESTISNQVTITITAPVENIPPTAILKASCAEISENCHDSVPGHVQGLSPLTVYFDGSDSSDIGGSIGSYQFDLGFGLNPPQTPPTKSNVYFSGNHVATLIVRDNEGAKSATSNHITIKIIDPTKNNPPTAILKASCAQSQDDCDDSVPGKIVGPAPLTVEFDGSISSDFDGSVEYYQFDLGSGLLPPENNPTRLRSYLASGNYTATLLVLDDHGAQSTPSNEVAITVTPPNGPPTAMLTASCAESKDNCDDSVPGNITGPAPLTVHLDGSGSNDTDGSIAHYHFFKQHGWSSPSTVKPNKSFTYHTPGSYTATLMVTDDKGAGSAQSIDITVTRSGSESDHQDQTSKEDTAIRKTKQTSDKPKTTSALDTERGRKERNRAFEEDSTVAELKREIDSAESRSAEDSERNQAERSRTLEEDSTLAELKREVNRAETRQATGDQNKAEKQGEASAEEGDRYDKKIEKLETEPCEGTKMDCHEA